MASNRPQPPPATYQLTTLNGRGHPQQRPPQGGSSQRGDSSSRSPGGTPRQPQRVAQMSMTPQGQAQAQAAAQTITSNSSRGQTTPCHTRCWNQAKSSIVAALRNAIVTSHKVDDYCGQPHGNCCVWCGRSCVTITGTMAIGGLLLALDACGVLNLFPQQNNGNNSTASASATSSGAYPSSAGGPFQFQARRTF